MSKSNRWQKAVVVLAQGGVFSAEKLCEEMQYNCVYRVSNVLLDTKLFAGAVIKSVREGRKVVGYELVNIEEMKQLIASGALSTRRKLSATTTKTVAKPKTVATKTVKATKTVTAKKAKPVSVPAEDSLQDIMNSFARDSAKKPIDLLDEIDTEVEDFQDREFASSYVKGSV